MLRPELPAHLRAEYQAYRAADRVLTRASRTGDTTGLVEVAEQFVALLPRQRTEEQLAAEREYNRQVRAYNAPILAARAARLKSQQAAANRAEVGAVRRAACPRCFATHAGEC